MGFKPPFEVGAVVSNAVLTEAFQVGNMGGMRRSKKTGTLVLISDNTKGLYHDAWHEGRLQYTGMGKTGDQSLTFSQNKTLAESRTNGVEVHLFEVNDPGKYTYSGVVELVAEPHQSRQPDENGNDRIVWIFPLKHKEEEPTAGADDPVDPDTNPDEVLVFNRTQGIGRIEKITSDKIYVDFNGKRRIFAYPDAIEKGYLAYLKDAETEEAENDAPEAGKAIRKQYWEYALPKLRSSFGPCGPYSNVVATDKYFKDGFYGVPGIHLYCTIVSRPKKCAAGLWIYLGRGKEEIAKAKAIFDLLQAQKEEIEREFNTPLIWDRKNRTNAASITVELAEDYTLPENWETISDFHVEVTRKMTDIIFKPNEAEIAKIVSGG